MSSFTRLTDESLPKFYKQITPFSDVMPSKHLLTCFQLVSKLKNVLKSPHTDCLVYKLFSDITTLSTMF